jgi:hypothetical protein
VRSFRSKSSCISSEHHLQKSMLSRARRWKTWAMPEMSYG